MNKELEETKYQYFYDYIIKVLSISKIGKLFSTDEYALSNYDQLQKISMEALEKFTNMKFDRSNYFSRDVYPTPNVSVRTCIFNKKNEILLVREKTEGKYSLPGGWCDLYDSPTEAASNECIQEAGARIKNIELIGLTNKGTYHYSDKKSFYNSVPEYQITFRAELDGELIEHEYETDKVGWFKLDALPELSSKCEKDQWLLSIKNAKDRIIFTN